MNNKYSSIWRMWFEKRTYNMNPVLHVEKRLHSHYSFKPCFSHIEQHVTLWQEWKSQGNLSFLFSFILPKIPKINAHRSPCFFLSVTLLHELPDTTGTQWLWLCIKPQRANGQSSLHWWHLFCHLELFHPLVHISLCHIFFCSANILRSILHPLTTYN